MNSCYKFVRIHGMYNMNLKLQTLINNSVLILVQESSSSRGRTSHNYLNILHDFWPRIKIRYMIKYCWLRLVLFIFIIEKQLRPSLLMLGQSLVLLNLFQPDLLIKNILCLSPWFINILYPPSSLLTKEKQCTT